MPIENCTSDQLDNELQLQIYAALDRQDDRRAALQSRADGIETGHVEAQSDIQIDSAIRAWLSMRLRKLASYES